MQMKFTVRPNKKKKSSNTNNDQPSIFAPRRKQGNKKSSRGGTSEHAEVADCYAEFVRSFEEGPSNNYSRSSTSTNFVHGGSLDPNSNRHTGSTSESAAAALNSLHSSSRASSSRASRSSRASGGLPTSSSGISAISATSAGASDAPHGSPTSSAAAAAILSSRKLTSRDLARLKKESLKSTKRRKGGAKSQIAQVLEEMRQAKQSGGRGFDPDRGGRDRYGSRGDQFSSRDDLAHTGSGHGAHGGSGAPAGAAHGGHSAHSGRNDFASGAGGKGTGATGGLASSGAHPLGGSHPSASDYTQSTNLYVGNLPLDISEPRLHQIFGKYGPIASVKIMWPRTEEEHARERLCGFVSYMRRSDAEQALNSLKDQFLFGERLRLGWGKPVAVSKKVKIANIPQSLQLTNGLNGLNPLNPINAINAMNAVNGINALQSVQSAAAAINAAAAKKEEIQGQNKLLTTQNSGNASQSANSANNANSANSANSAGGGLKDGTGREGSASNGAMSKDVGKDGKRTDAMDLDGKRSNATEGVGALDGTKVGKNEEKKNDAVSKLSAQDTLAARLLDTIEARLLGQKKFEVKVPKNQIVKNIIDHTSVMVSQYGDIFERELMKNLKSEWEQDQKQKQQIAQEYEAKLAAYEKNRTQEQNGQNSQKTNKMDTNDSQDKQDTQESSGRRRGKSKFSEKPEAPALDAYDKWSFLFDQSGANPLHIYYRWRVFSITMGDSKYQWRTVPFQIIVNGPHYIPPNVPDEPDYSLDDALSGKIASRGSGELRSRGEGRDRYQDHDHRSDGNAGNLGKNGGHTDGTGRDGDLDNSSSFGRGGSASKSGGHATGLHANSLRSNSSEGGSLLNRAGLNDRVRLADRPLNEEDRRKLTKLLRTLTPHRYKIKEAMIFCLDHSDRATEVSEILSESLTLRETTHDKKMARLYLMSDILCNCNAGTVVVKNASAYRIEFRKYLKEIYLSLRECWMNNIESRLKAKEMKDSVIKVVRVWEKMFIFPTFFTKDLENIFLGRKSLTQVAQSQGTQGTQGTQGVSGNGANQRQQDGKGRDRSDSREKNGLRKDGMSGKYEKMMRSGGDGDIVMGDAGREGREGRDGKKQETDRKMSKIEILKQKAMQAKQLVVTQNVGSGGDVAIVPGQFDGEPMEESEMNNFDIDSI